MRYCEVTFSVVSVCSGLDVDNFRDLLSYHLAEIGYDTFMCEGERLCAYIPLGSYSASALEPVLSTALDLGYHLTFECRECEDRDWNEEWEKHYFRPLVIDDICVRASFHPAIEDVDCEIVIDPKMAFGTGNHGTTAGMLKLLRGLSLSQRVVIDMGCGSGILGIYAALRGAASVWAVDIDEWAVRNARQNASLNGVSVTVVHGDARSLEALPVADVFLANINRNIILTDLEHYLRHLSSDGRLLLSGFYRQDLPLLSAALSAHGWRPGREVYSDEWVAIEYVRSV